MEDTNYTQLQVVYKKINAQINAAYYPEVEKVFKDINMLITLNKLFKIDKSAEPAEFTSSKIEVKISKHHNPELNFADYGAKV